MELPPETCTASSLHKYNKLCIVVSRWTIIHIKFAVFELQTALSNFSQIQLNRYGKQTDRQNDLQMYTKRKVIRPAFERYTVPV